MLTATGLSPISAISTITLPGGLTDINDSVTGDAAYDAATHQIHFAGSIGTGALAVIIYRATVDLGAAVAVCSPTAPT